MPKQAGEDPAAHDLSPDPFPAGEGGTRISLAPDWEMARLKAGVRSVLPEEQQP
jgi:hypothetical protein